MLQNSEEFIPQLTADGSFTFFSNDFGEAFHSHFGAYQESLLKFVQPTLTVALADLGGNLSTPHTQQPSLRLLDICYGLGYNTAAALATIWALNPNCFVEVIGLEINPSVPRSAIAHNLLNNLPQPIPQLLTALATQYTVKTERLKATLLIGDARTTIEVVQKSGFQADAIFLDPFSPPNCPQLWTVEFLAQVAQCLSSTGRLATYSCAAAVRTALIAAGLKIGSTPPVGRRSPGTVASWIATVPPLPRQEQEHLLTRAAIPYRDPHLSDSAEIILQRRQQEQQASSLEPTSQWRKRQIVISH